MMYWLKFAKNVPKWSIWGMTSRPKLASVGTSALIESPGKWRSGNAAFP